MNQKGLKTTLRINAGFSGLSGLALLAAAGRWAELFQANPWLFRGVGVGLLLFAVDLIVTSFRVEIPRSKALYFSFSDFGWVVGSALLVLLAPLSSTAILLVGGVAIVVLTFAIVQIRCIGAGGVSPT